MLGVWQWRSNLPTRAPLYSVAVQQMAAKEGPDKMESDMEVKVCSETPSCGKKWACTDIH